MARRHYNIENKVPQYWGAWEFVIDLTSATSLTVGVFSTTSNYSTSYNRKPTLIIDWGDGTTETKELAATSTTHQHTFPSKSVFTVHIDEVFIPNEEQARVTKLLFNAQSYDCLTHINIYKSDEITNIDQICNNRKKLIGFGNGFKFEVPNCLTTSGTFYGCTGLTSLPSGIFDIMTKITSFYYICPNCTGLTSLPSKLFRYNTKCTNYSQIFAYCSALTANLNDVFDGATLNKVINTSYGFRNCKITGEALPIIAKLTSATTISGTFNNCTTLTDYTSIPATWK